MEGLKMARSEHKRQLKLAKRNKRVKELHKERNQQKSMSNRERIAGLRGARWITCTALSCNGMWTIAAVRRGKGFDVLVQFLVDTRCLGVKDAFFRFDPDLEAVRSIERDHFDEAVRTSMTPSGACKLILNAIEYARSVGLEPHPETAACLGIFADIDPNECDEKFEFGVDGRPYYISGPNDSLEFQLRVTESLEKKVGAGDFDSLTAFNDRDLLRHTLNQSNLFAVASLLKGQKLERRFDFDDETDDVIHPSS
jgi:hypothetical protein